MDMQLHGGEVVMPGDARLALLSMLANIGPTRTVMGIGAMPDGRVHVLLNDGSGVTLEHEHLAVLRDMPKVVAEYRERKELGEETKGG